MSDNFSAVHSMLGYLFQVQYSLLEILTQDSFQFLTIEKFDDIAIQDTNQNTKLLQLKHHKSGSLSDSSGDLWKTIRIWCAGINNKQLDVNKTKFTIITTQIANEDSIAYYLTPRGRQASNALNAKDVIKKLWCIAESSANKENKLAYEEFKVTELDKLERLIDNILIIDSSPYIQDVEHRIKKQIRYVCSIQHIDAFHERLEGWWFKRVIKHLVSEGLPPIAYNEVRYKVDDLREQFLMENLPIDFSEDIEIDAALYQDNIFMEQLKLINVQGRRCINAIHDYYKASAQRSRWSREELVSIEEIEKYESKLQKEWERIFDATIDCIEDELEHEKNKIRCGKQIYNTIELDTQINIRKNCTESYVMRGSYHMLSDALRIGWHPDFKQILNRVNSKQKGA